MKRTDAEADAVIADVRARLASGELTGAGGVTGAVVMTTTDARPSGKEPTATQKDWHYDQVTFPAGQHTLAPGGYPGQRADVYARHALAFGLDSDAYKEEKAGAWEASATGAYLQGGLPYIRRGTEGSCRYLVVMTPGQAAAWWPVAGKTDWGEIRSAGIGPSPGSRHPGGELYEAVPGPDTVRYPDGTVLGTNVVRFDAGLKAALIADGAHGSDDQDTAAGDADLPGDDGRCRVALKWLADANFTGATRRGTRANAAANYLKKMDAEGHRIGGIVAEVIAALPATSDADFAAMWSTVKVPAERPLIDPVCCAETYFGGLKARSVNGHGPVTDPGPDADPGTDAAAIARFKANTPVCWNTDGTLRGAAPGIKAAPPPRRHIVLTAASTITPAKVRWAWRDRLPCGSLSLMLGREGASKSTLSLHLAACVTRGTLDGEHHGTPRAVLVSATEDSWEHTLVPRLTAAGADLALVHRVSVETETGSEDALTLPFDAGELTGAIETTKAALVILDPIMSRLDGHFDSHKDADTRRALEPLARAAQDTGAAVVGLIHQNKSGSTDALNSMMGSRAFAALARAVLVVMADPSDQTGARRVVGLAKSNLGRMDVPMLGYEICGAGAGTDADGELITAGAVRWLPHGVPGSLADFFADTIRGPEKVTAVDRAADWLESWIGAQGGRAESSAVKAAGTAAGHREHTLKRALKAAGVTTENIATKPRRTLWVLTDSDGNDEPEQPGSSRDSQDTSRPSLPEFVPTSPQETSKVLTNPYYPAGISAPPVGTTAPAPVVPTGKPAVTSSNDTGDASRNKTGGGPPREAGALLCACCGGMALIASQCAHHPDSVVIPGRCPAPGCANGPAS